jgi:hypothetical protein
VPLGLVFDIRSEHAIGDQISHQLTNFDGERIAMVGRRLKASLCWF